MAKGIEIAAAVDGRAAKRGIETGLIEPLEDAQEELLELGKSRGPEQLERDLEAAARASKELEKETKDAARTIEREYRDSYRKMKQSSDDATDSAKRNAEEFKAEATQNFAETASSFDGSMESIADMAQGTLGGLATSIGGPLGIAAAGAGAAAGAVLTSWIRTTEETKERVAAMYEDMLESGNRYLSASRIQEGLGKLLDDENALRQVREDAKQLGLEEEVVMLARVGHAESLEAVLTRAAEQEAQAKADAEAHAEAYGAVSGELAGIEAAAAALRDRYEQVGEGIGAAAERAELMESILVRLVNSSEKYAAELDDLPDSISTDMRLNLPDPVRTARDLRIGLQREMQRNPILIPVQPQAQYGRDAG